MSGKGHQSAERIPIFSLCKKDLPHFISKLTWIPRNGAKIQIWDDSILGDQPLNGANDLEKIKAWLKTNNCSTLWDISSWKSDDNEAWENWNLGDYPIELQEEALKCWISFRGNRP